MKIRVVAVIQARVASRRLPKKMLKLIEGQTMLGRVVSRIKLAKTVDEVVVATSISKSDDAIEKLCREKEWAWFRGNEQDVLDRVYKASLYYRADAVVRITGDCPLIDPEVIDAVVGRFLSRYPEIDYGSNLLPRTYPRGLDTEVVRIGTLGREWHNGEKWREHVTLNIRKNPQLYRICNVANEVDYSYMRWCVDTVEDLKFARKVYAHFKDNHFGWQDVVRLLEKYPEWVIRDMQEDPK